MQLFVGGRFDIGELRQRRVVNENIDATELLQRFIDQRRVRCRLGNIALNRYRFATARFDQGHGIAQCTGQMFADIFQGARRADYGGTLRCQTLSDRRADAAAGSSDYSNFVG